MRLQVLLGRAAPVELAVRGLDLLGVAGALFGLGLEGGLGQNAVEQRDRERRRLLEDSAGVVLGREREGAPAQRSGRRRAP